MGTPKLFLYLFVFTFNVVLVSGVQQSESVTHINISILFSHRGYYKLLSRFSFFLNLFIYLFFVFLPFLEPLPQHMEVPRLGVELEL